jgi:uncharacterized delta-60 repeat protein
VLAASGDLDTSFGASSSGVNYTDLGGGEKAFGIALQNDGKIVVVGTDATRFVVARYTSAGALDTAGFGGGAGYVTTTIGDAAEGHDVAIQADGSIVVAGTVTYGARTYFAVARYQTNGQLDTTFNSTGIVTSTLSTGVSDAAHAVAIDNNNKILVAGTVDRDFGVVRYTSAGALDNGFGTGGLATVDFAGSNDEGWDMITHSDNKILVAGFADTGSSDDFGLARFTPAGNLDTTFGGGDGIVSTDFGGQSIDQALGIDLQADGRIILAGLHAPAGGGASTDFALARYTSDGSLDLTFDTDGRVTTDFAGFDEEAYDVRVQPTGRIVAVGFTFSGGATVQDFALARYLSSGALDASFGAGGLVATNFGTQLPENSNTADYAYATAIQPDNKIVIAGFTDYPVASGDDNLAIARYESPNTAPTVTSFDKSGTEDTTLSLSAADFTGSFSDADNDTLQKIQVTALSADGALKLNGATVALNQEIAVADLDNLTFAPNSNFAGLTSFSWNGSDGLDYAVTIASANLTFSGVNDAPVLDAIGAQSGNELSLITFTATTTDPDTVDTLTYSMDLGAPTGASINPSSGVFTWTPTETQGPGSYSVTVRVTDNGTPALSDFETFSISVSEVNVAPVLTAIGSKTLDEEVLLSFNASASDSDIPTNSLSYSLDAGAPTGASIDPTSGAFTWTPSEAQGPGVYTITVRVTDNGAPAMDDFEEVSVTVNEVNIAPTLQDIDKTLPFTDTVAYALADFTGAFSDVDGNSLVNIKVTSLPTYGVLSVNSAPVALDQVIPAANLDTLRFTPQNGWFGSTVFTWNGFDGTVYAAADAQATIHIGAPVGALYLPVVLLGD